MQTADDNQATGPAGKDPADAGTNKVEVIRIEAVNAGVFQADTIKLHSTIAALRPHMSEYAAKETEAILIRMFERAKRWDKR